MATPVTYDPNGNPLYKCQYCGLLVNVLNGGYNVDGPGGDEPMAPGNADDPSDPTGAPVFDVCPAFSNGSPHVPF